MNQKIKTITTRNEIPVFLEQNYKNGIGIELGVALGQYLVELAEGWKSGRLYGIDCWEQQPFEIYNDPLNNPAQKNMYTYVQERIQPYNERVRIYKMFTTEAVEQFPDNYFDFIYIDANHAYEPTLKDIELYYPKLKQGGLFGGHDYEDDGKYGVKKAVNEFFKGREIHVTSCSSWYVVDQ
jgi:hypothetical protein